MGNQKSSSSMDRLEVLEVLVDELEKSRPREEMVKDYMKQVGLKYNKDNIENIDSILNEIRFFAGDLGIKSK